MRIKYEYKTFKISVVFLFCGQEDALKIAVVDELDAVEPSCGEGIGQLDSKLVLLHVGLRSLGSLLLPAVSPCVEQDISLSCGHIVNEGHLKPVHRAAHLQQPVHLVDHSDGVGGRHLVQNIGVVDEVKCLGFKPAHLLCICLVELDVGDVPHLRPHPCHPDVGRGEVNSDHLSLREHLGEDKGRKAGTCADVEDPLEGLGAVQVGQPLLQQGLVEEVELGLAQVGEADRVPVEVAARQEVDKGLVEVVGDVAGEALGLHIGVVRQSGESWIGVGELGKKNFGTQQSWTGS